MIAITRTIITTYSHSVGRMKNFLMLKLVEHIASESMCWFMTHHQNSAQNHNIKCS